MFRLVKQKGVDQIELPRVYNNEIFRSTFLFEKLIELAANMALSDFNAYADIAK